MFLFIFSSAIAVEPPKPADVAKVIEIPKKLEAPNLDTSQLNLDRNQVVVNVVTHEQALGQLRSANERVDRWNSCYNYTKLLRSLASITTIGLLAAIMTPANITDKCLTNQGYFSAIAGSALGLVIAIGIVDAVEYWLIFREFIDAKIQQSTLATNPYNKVITADNKPPQMKF